jgi:hypothetical protein
VVTGASRRLATAVLAVGMLLPATQLVAGAAWADDPSPSPDAVTEPVAPDLPAEGPLVEPSIGSWIIGGTELEGTQAKPAAAAPVTVTRHTTAVRGTTATTRTTTHRTTTTPASAPSVGGATVLPFTGGHVTSLAPTGLALVLGGVALVLASRPRRQPARV